MNYRLKWLFAWCLKLAYGYLLPTLYLGVVPVAVYVFHDRHDFNWWQFTLVTVVISWVFWSNIHDESDTDVIKIGQAKKFKPSDYLPGGRLYKP